MKYSIGRNNLAMTVFVPYDCTNNCSFCTTKCLYKNSIDTALAEKTISEYLDMAEKSSMIKEIVFTGGEPMMDVGMLGRFCKHVPSKDVYINTNLIKDNFFDFVKLVNKTSNILGVNVSRHQINPEMEPKNQVEDWCIQAFEKPIRVNVVIPETCSTANEFISFVEKILNRWNNQSVVVNFRADYRKVTSETLHSFDTEEVSSLIRNYEFMNHNYCEVCDSMSFFDPVMGKKFIYHRGLQSSSINMRSQIIVNDVILLPDENVKDDAKSNYLLCYDWDKNQDMDFADFIFDGSGKKKRRTTSTTPIPKKAIPPLSASISEGGGCGFSSC